ncbi:hypothetical protein GCM10010124_41210 [Pilimelia terevasa]|uniref:Pyrrolo-quinoline quinone repeat domain-containing protein n=2 Tax=Pilimelia terevasa TaxID=53372 RepID=A0A8J3BV35_9ACTN|nr:hypothetical protein GCM10010124_41210 [Pilimelia terevasa]
MDGVGFVSRRTALVGAAALAAAGWGKPAAARSRSTPEPRWTLPLPAVELTSPIWVHAGVVYLVRPQLLTAYNAADGRLMWDTPVGPVDVMWERDLEWRLAVGGDRLFLSHWHDFGSDANRRLLAFRRADGTPLWAHDLRYRAAGLAAAGDDLYVEGGNHLAVRYLQIRHAVTGAVRVNRDGEGLQGGPGPVGEVPGRLLIDDIRGGINGSLRLLDTAGGQIFWEQRGTVRRGLRSLDLGESFLVAAAGGLAHLHAADGATDWEVLTPGGLDDIAHHQGIAYALTSEALTAFDSGSGGRLWRHRRPHWSASLDTTAGRLLLRVNDELRTLDPRTGDPTAEPVTLSIGWVGTDADSCYAVRDDQLTAWTVT